MQKMHNYFKMHKKEKNARFTPPPSHPTIDKVGNFGARVCLFTCKKLPNPSKVFVYSPRPTHTFGTKNTIWLKKMKFQQMLIYNHPISGPKNILYAPKKLIYGTPPNVPEKDQDSGLAWSTHPQKILIFWKHMPQNPEI